MTETIERPPETATMILNMLDILRTYDAKQLDEYFADRERLAWMRELVGPTITEENLLTDIYLNMILGFGLPLAFILCLARVTYVDLSMAKACRFPLYAPTVSNDEAGQ